MNLHVASSRVATTGRDRDAAATANARARAGGSIVLLVVCLVIGWGSPKLGVVGALTVAAVVAIRVSEVLAARRLARTEELHFAALNEEASLVRCQYRMFRDSLKKSVREPAPPQLPPAV